jgi:nucleoid-associated protein YgaU
MDPATVFLLYAISTLSVWLLATAVRPAVAAMAHVGRMLPTARPLMALVVSTVLLLGIVRAGNASGSVGPASQRMEQMVDSFVGAPPDSRDVVSRLRPMTSISTNHVVVKGDSLWGIARSVLSGSGPEPAGASISELWKSIYELNRDLIGDDPNLIHPGQILQLPGR